MANSSAAAGVPNRIDVHHHIAPPRYLQELSPPARVPPPTANWTAERSIEMMDEGGIDMAITSITLPGLWFGEHAQARRLARLTNDFAAKLRSDYPGRFGMFVNLPLPDVDGSLAEIAYGLDDLKADGVVLFTSYGDTWLGDAVFDPVYEELNRRKAVVYTHPKTPQCCVNILGDIPDHIVEYQTDTSRAIARVVFGGVAAKYPDLRFIWSHGGGTMPFIVDRYIRHAETPEMAPHFPDGFLPVAAKFFYDTAQVASRAAMAALRAVAPVDNIVYGTDFPFLPGTLHNEGLRASGVFNDQELRAIDRDNILRWMPQYAR